MGLFNQFFSQHKNQDKTAAFWKFLENEQDLQKAIETSKEKLVIIFKHSTRCFISKTVLKNFENQVKNTNALEVDFYVLDLLQYRDISNKIERDLQVIHQSPQLIVLKNQVVVHYASHENINLKDISKYVC